MFIGVERHAISVETSLLTRVIHAGRQQRHGNWHVKTHVNGPTCCSATAHTSTPMKRTMVERRTRQERVVTKRYDRAFVTRSNRRLINANRRDQRRTANARGDTRQRRIRWWREEAVNGEWQAFRRGIIPSARHRTNWRFEVVRQAWHKNQKERSVVGTTTAYRRRPGAPAIRAATVRKPFR